MIQREAQALDALNTAFQEQVSVRHQGLTMSVEFFKLAKELSTLLDTVTSAARASSTKLSSVTEKFQTLQMKGVELINHMKQARRDHETPTDSPNLRANHAPSRSTEGSVRDTLSKIHQTLEQYQKKAKQQGVMIPAHRGSIKDLEDVLVEIDTAVMRTLQGTASPAPPSAAETQKTREEQNTREEQKTAIARRNPNKAKRSFAPMQFSLWDREGSVRQLRRKFEKIASDEKPPAKSEEQKLMDRVFRDPFVAQARLKQTSSVQQVVTVNKQTTQQEHLVEDVKPHPIVRGRPSIEKLRIDRNVSKLRTMFDATQGDSFSKPPVIIEDTSEDPTNPQATTDLSFINVGLANTDLTSTVVYEADSFVSPCLREKEVEEEGKVAGSVSERHSVEVSPDLKEDQPADETDFGFRKKKSRTKDSVDRKSFRSLR